MDFGRKVIDSGMKAMVEADLHASTSGLGPGAQLPDLSWRSTRGFLYEHVRTSRQRRQGDRRKLIMGGCHDHDVRLGGE
jgi:hypothetical protein